MPEQNIDIPINTDVLEANHELPPSPSQEKNTQLQDLESTLYQKTEELVGKIPEWLPFIPAYIKGKMGEQRALTQLTRGVDLSTGEKNIPFPDRLKRFTATELNALFNQGLAALDIIALGGGTEASVIAKTLANPGAEGKIIDCIVPALKSIIPKVENKTASNTISEIARVFGVLAANDTTRPMMTNWLSQQSWWKTLKTSFPTNSGTTS